MWASTNTSTTTAAEFIGRGSQMTEHSPEEIPFLRCSPMRSAKHAPIPTWALEYLSISEATRMRRSATYATTLGPQSAEQPKRHTGQKPTTAVCSPNCNLFPGRAGLRRSSRAVLEHREILSCYPPPQMGV